MSKQSYLPREGDFVGQVATEWNVLHQWSGEKWVRVEEYHRDARFSRGFIRFDVEDMNPDDKDDAVDLAFRPATQADGGTK